MEIHRSTWGTAWDFHWHPRMGRAVAKSFRRALARTICVGGDGTIDRLAFGNYCGQGRTTAQLKTIALDLLKDTAVRATAIVETHWRAAERISFSAVRRQLAFFFNRLVSKPSET